MKINKPIESILKQKLSLLLGSLVLSLILWTFVVSKNEYSMVLDLPIEARNLSVQKALKKEVPTTAKVRLNGTGRDLFKSFLLKRFAGFKLVLDLEGISQEYEFILNDYFKKYPQKVVLPLNYNVSFVEVIYPNRVNISLDEYSVKKVPVISNISVKPAPGYIQVGESSIIPEEIQIAGPKKELAIINHVETIVDTIMGIINPYNNIIRLQTLGRLIELSKNSVEINIDIQNISERIIADIPVQVINIPKKIRVFPSPQTVSLTVVGGIERIASLGSNDIEIIIDFKIWNNQTQFYEPQVIIPDDILSWKDISPKNLEIAVARELK